MSTQPTKPTVKAVRRPAAKKSTKTAEAQPAVVEPQTEAPVVTEAKKVKETKDKTTRRQGNKVCGTTISSARVRRHVDKLNMNKTIIELLKPLKATVNEYTRAKALVDAATTRGDGVLSTEEQAATEAVAKLESTIKDVSDRVAALTSERVRFSNEAPIVLSIVCDEVMFEILKHAMDRALEAEKKIIHINHVHAKGVEKLSLYPLFKSLPSFASVAESTEKAQQKAYLESEVKAAREGPEKELKKALAKLATKKKAKGAPAPVAVVAEPVVEPAVVPEVLAEPVDVVEEVEDELDSKTKFNFYVGAGCKQLISSDAKYARIRVSTEIREYISNLLIELIARLSTLIQLTTEAMGVKTVNDTAIMKTIEGLLVDGYKPVETYEFVPTQVVDPVALKVEQAKKEEAKKNETEYKFDVNSLPRVTVYTAVRSVHFQPTGFDALNATVVSKLNIYHEHMKQEAEQAKAEQVKVEQAKTEEVKTEQA